MKVKFLDLSKQNKYIKKKRKTHQKYIYIYISQGTGDKRGTSDRRIGFTSTLYWFSLDFY